MKILISIVLWIIVARVFLWLGKFIWPEDNDNNNDWRY